MMFINNFLIMHRTLYELINFQIAVKSKANNKDGFTVIIY